MNSRVRNLVLYVILILIAMLIGGDIIKYIISGIITLASFVFLVESSDTLKKVVFHCNKLIDIAIFCFGIYAKMHFGVTIAMALLFAGLGYSMIYGPYVREMYAIKNNKSK